jgi:CheY-like chemotaxis protein
MSVGTVRANGLSHKISVLLIDRNSERRALRTKVLALRGIDVVGATDVIEATAIWQPDRYDLILVDIRLDHRSCIAWRDEIKKQKPKQIVAFLVGKPNYLALDPLLGSYVSEEQGAQWGDALRLAITNGCESLPQRYGLLEARWRIAAGKKLTGASSPAPQPAYSSQPLVDDSVLYTPPTEIDTEADA